MTGLNRYEKIWKSVELTWEELKDKLRTPQRTTETQGQYFNMAKQQQDNIKDVGGFVGGVLKDGRRKSENVVNRSILTLDADFATKEFITEVDLSLSCRWCAYSTHKHTPDNPRFRLIIPLSRPVDAEEYEAIARRVAGDIGIDMFDDTTYQVHRLMYYPSTPCDVEFEFQEAEGEELDVDRVLARYDDWKDVSAWPTSSRTLKLRDRVLKNQEDPTEKKGAVGIFCRAYTVPEAIDKFLPGVYLPCTAEGRYTFAKGSTAGGAVLYEDGKFLYSNHATDPCSGQLVNAFDLVRLHKFNHLDEDVNPKTNLSKYPSYTAMIDLANADDGFRKTLYKEQKNEAYKDFDIREEEENENDDWILELEVGRKADYVPTINNLKLILENDPLLKNKIQLDEFHGRVARTGALPWEAKVGDWTDTDDQGLKHYIEKVYRLYTSTKLLEAFGLATYNSRFHPVKDYLDGLIWDGVERLDTLLIKYLGAEDSKYTRIVTRKTLVSAVARIYQPGCKVDTMLILVGQQGCGKSQLVAKLGKVWYSDTLDDFKTKEAYSQLQGNWIIEVAELAGMRKSDIETVKHFISKREDNYREAYARNTKTHKRQCILIGTTNKYEFLRDSTGNRRFLPINVRNADRLKELDIGIVDQVWAEAVEAYSNCEQWYLEGEEVKLAEEVQEEHFEQNAWTEEILRYLDLPLPANWNELSLVDRRNYYNSDFGDCEKGTVERVKASALEIWTELFGGGVKESNARISSEINSIIEKAGWHRDSFRVSTGDGRKVVKGFSKYKKV